MSKNLEKLAEVSEKAESKTDAILVKIVNFPYSWIPALVVVVLAAYGTLRLFI